MPLRTLEEDHLFGSGKPVLGKRNQTSVQTGATAKSMPVRPQSNNTVSAIGKHAERSVLGGVKSLRWVNPVSNPVLRGYQKGSYNPSSNTFGMVRHKGKRPHQGLDILAKPGTPILAVRDGVVSKIKDTGTEGFGKSVMLKFETSTGETRYAFYGHLSEIKRKEGDEVKAGTILGQTGHTGNLKGIPSDEWHLHFGIAKVDNPDVGLDDWENPLHYIGYIQAQEESDDDSE